MLRSRITLIPVFVLVTALSLPAGADQSCCFMRHGPEGSYYVNEAQVGGEIAASSQDAWRDDVIWQRTIDGSCYTNASYCFSGERIFASADHSPVSGVMLHETWGDGTPPWTVSGGDSYSDGAKWESVCASVETNSGISGASIHCWSVDSETPLWSEDIADCLVAGRCIKVSDHGEVVAVALNMQAGFARIHCYDVTTGTLLSSFDCDSGDYGRSLEISSDGSVVALRAGRPIYVIESATSDLRWRGGGGANADPLGLSGDGSLVAAGFSWLRVWEWNGSTYDTKWTTICGSNILRQCIFSDAGNLLVAAWYPTSYDQNVVQCFDPASSTPLWTYDYTQSGGSYQDIPVAIATTNHGDYFVVGSWGSQFNTNDEIHVFSRESSTPEFTVDAPGSIYDVDICHRANGTILVTACGKHVHANEMGNGGDLFSICDLDPAAIDETLVLPVLSAYPNPCNPRVMLSYTMPRAGQMTLSIFSPDGRLIRSLDGGCHGAGTHTLSWDGRTDDGDDAASGVYLVKLRTEQGVTCQRGITCQQRLVVLR
ncbi:MAG: T9SS type A sorting domain-containing protein [Candidatus Eisenbacteria sp.]|nr:T9SS type A sorting domain-containing protein [Candidatus Eisenbacteria bacterium]